MLKYEKGDLFKSGADILAHGCNTTGGFGSGVAAVMAKQYPMTRRAYFEKYDRGDWKLGDVQFVPVNNGKWVANCATQKEYYPRNKVHANYDAIRTCMETVKKFAMSKNLTVAVPKLGAGLGGGDWSIIESILKEVFTDYDVTVYVLK